MISAQWFLLAAASSFCLVSTSVYAVEPDLPKRIAAAQTTAQNAQKCIDAQPYYWEIGDSQGKLASGRVGRDAPTENTPMAYASASKWIYAAYVAEQRHGVLSDSDYSSLNFTSGYTRFRICMRGDTVQSCQSRFINGRGEVDRRTLGYFYYNGGHMQQHAMQMGLAELNNEGFASAIRNGLAGALGSDWDIRYRQPQPAGGGAGTPNDYARFLRGILSGALKMNGLLGTHAVCTNPKTCPSSALKTPIPSTESWHYSVGHWLEDDPSVGDGSFSSPGAFGFYPWIDASKRFYGIVAREEHSGILASDPGDKPAIQSVSCGRLIRAAWEEGTSKR